MFCVTLSLQPAMIFVALPTTNWQTRSHKTSATGTRTRVARVKAEYPNQLDYSGSVHVSAHLSYWQLGRDFPKCSSQQHTPQSAMKWTAAQPKVLKIKEGEFEKICKTPGRRK